MSELLVSVWIVLKSTASAFFFFFFEKRILAKFMLFQQVSCTVHGTYKPLFSAKLSLKMGHTTLFTHLKIILLQCFQFLAISGIQTHPQYTFGSKLKCRLILLFCLFLLLFMSPTAFFGIIHEFYCTISTNFYLYLLYFQQNKQISNKPLVSLPAGLAIMLISIFHVESHGHLVCFPGICGSIFYFYFLQRITVFSHRPLLTLLLYQSHHLRNCEKIL